MSQKIPNRGTAAKNTKPNYDSLPTIDSTFTGDRELKGSVSIKGIPVEVNYGTQHLIFSEEFQLEKLNYNFNLKGLGMSYLDGQLTTVDQKYAQYSERVQSDIERQAKANDAERDSKGFLFNVLNGMSGGQKVGEAIRSEVQGRVTGAIAEAVGLPSSFVGALVGGGGMKQAIHAYERSLTTQAISQATGVPAWYIDSQIAEKEETHKMASSFHYNMGRAQAAPVLLVAGLARGAASAYSPLSGMKKKADALNRRAKKFADHLGREAYENREVIDTAITVGATIAAPFTGGASLVGLTIYKAMEGAAEGGVLGAMAGAATIGNAFLYEFTGGMVSYDLSYSYEDGFGASVGSGMKIVEGLGIGSTLSYNEQNGFGASFGLQAGTSALSYNAGLSYSQSGGISANAGIGLGLGRNAATGSYSSTLNLGVSYNRRDGFGTSVGISRNNNVVMPGVGASISRSEYGGFGADITSNQYGQTEGTAGRPGFGGVSGGLSWSERDGFTASFNVSGTNAFSYNSQTGLSSNSDFLSQYAMNNGLSQGVAQTDEEKAHTARVEAEERARAAQNRNNSEQGASNISAAGVLTQRRDEDGLPAHGAPGLNDPGQTLSSSGSFGPEGESSGVGRRPLSSEDKAAFWENWRGETRAQTDASLADLRRMGYDTSELEGRVQAYRNNQDSRPGTTSTPQPTTHQSQGTGLYGGVVQNILNSAMSGASSLWDRITGGRPVAHQTAPVFELDNGARLPFENQGSGYGRVRNLHDPQTGETRTTGPHSGLDQPQASGTPVPVVADGKVILVNRDFRTRTEGGNGYGAVVVVQHNNGIFTLYGHNSNVLVNIGDTVTRGQVISNVGNSGNSWGAHMHYEVRTGNNVTKENFYGRTQHHDPSTFNWNQ
ncbi:peptidoglycan DD-metalloendopeptidase family protein [Leptospira santarosai]|uniref:peptidoglycan DD-metalloendopeptidase family protein n=4 Tax=Leptospira santarosai TaxID=28183 RepID=UPI0024AEB7FA|nr:peptidoglycan DD-metalloendopeptidase family protein [Leptospira santarosai]MDI7187937.1 peptidoglycan DD-metalloendopeptidase family protein [Leptospira santarosai]